VRTRLSARQGSTCIASLLRIGGLIQLGDGRIGLLLFYFAVTLRICASDSLDCPLPRLCIVSEIVAKLFFSNSSWYAFAIITDDTLLGYRISKDHDEFVAIDSTD